MTIHRRVSVRWDADTILASRGQADLWQIHCPPSPAECSERPGPRLQTTDTPICPASTAHQQCSDEATPDYDPVYAQQVARPAPDRLEAIHLRHNDRTVSTITFQRRLAVESYACL